MKAEILKQINDITAKLIFLGLAEEQNFPAENDGTIYISGNKSLSIALKNIPYSEIYKHLNENKNYNIKMLDGALIQIMYTFNSDNTLIKSRLAFFPSPTLEEFQNNIEIYELDEIYADILNKNIITTPLRFDYDPCNFTIIDHPKSHLTIGQYKNCRIPVSCPISPYMFISFILRSFYNTATSKYSDQLNFDTTVIFDNCIQDLETRMLHVSVA